MFVHRILAALVLVLSMTTASATHILGGEIRYSHVSGYTYSISVLLWCDLNSPADRPEIGLEFGDGLLDTVPRTTMLDDPTGNSCGSLRYNEYATTHTFAGPGRYVLRFTDQNRRGGIVNVPNSVAQAFSVSAVLVVDPVTGANNSVRFNTPQVVSDWNWSTLVHEPQASDADGDSLAFQLVLPEGLNGDPIVGYQGLEQYTSPGGFAWCNPANGDLLWDHPTLIGEYTIAIRCDEWRNGILVGQVTRDMMLCVANLPTAIPDGSATIELVTVMNSSNGWIVENNTARLVHGELIDARGALVRSINLAPGRTVIASDELPQGLIVLLASDGQGHQRAYKLIGH